MDQTSIHQLEGKNSYVLVHLVLAELVFEFVGQKNGIVLISRVTRCSKNYQGVGVWVQFRLISISVSEVKDFSFIHFEDLFDSSSILTSCNLNCLAVGRWNGCLGLKSKHKINI